MTIRFANVRVILSLLLVGAAVFAPLVAAAQNTSTNLIVNLPGGGGDTVSGINDYIARIYRAALIAGAFLAMLLIVVGAAQWGLSAGSESAKRDAKSRITNAILGLVLLLGVALILFFVNPALVNLQQPSGGGGGGGVGGGGGNPITSTGGGAPSITGIERLANGNLRITWTDNSSNEDHFDIQYSYSPTLASGSEAGWHTAGTSAAGTGQYTFTSDGSYFRVVAVTGGQNGERAASGPVASPGYPLSSSMGQPSIASVYQADPANPTAVSVLFVDNASNEETYLLQGLAGGPTTPVTLGQNVGATANLAGDWTLITTQGPVAPGGQLGNYGTFQFGNVSTNAYTTVRVGAQRTENGQSVFNYSTPHAVPPPQAQAALPDPAAAPSNLNYAFTAFQGAPAILLTWQDNASNETSFKVYLNYLTASGFGNWTPIFQTIGPNAPTSNNAQATLTYGGSGADINLNPSSGTFAPGGVVTIQLNVAAAYGGGEALAQSPLTIQIVPGANQPQLFALPSPQAAPSNVSFNVSGGALAVTWTNNASNATNFITQYQNQQGGWSTMGTVTNSASAPATSMTVNLANLIPALSPGTYQVHLCAVNTNSTPALSACALAQSVTIP